MTPKKNWSLTLHNPIDPDVFARCVEACVAVDRRRRGHEYDGPCALDILEAEGLSEIPSVFGMITEAANEAILASKKADLPKGYACTGCGRTGYSSEKNLRQHQVEWCRAAVHHDSAQDLP